MKLLDTLLPCGNSVTSLLRENKRNMEYAALAVCVFYLFVFFLYYSFGYTPFLLKNFCRWDSFLYQSIAESGYEFIPVNEVIYNGNCGWFPLYPFLIFLIRTCFRLDYYISAFLLSFVCTYGLVFMQLKIASEFSADKAHAVKIVPVSLLFVGSIYLTAAFPRSLCLFLLHIAMYCVLKEKYILSGGFLFAACTAYSTAFLFCGVFGIYFLIALIQKKIPFRTFLFRILEVPVLGFLGWGLVQFILFCFTGNMQAFFLTQKKYGHGLHSPLKTLSSLIGELKSENIVLSQQSFFSMLFFALVLFTTCVVIRKHLLGKRLYVLSYFSMLIVYLFLLIMGSGVSPWRQYLLCNSGAFILALEPKKRYSVLVLCGGYIFIILTKLFVEGIIV